MSKQKNSKTAETKPELYTVLPAVFQDAIKVADEIEEQVRIVMPTGTSYDIILKISQYTADRMKSVIPMYTGNLNPKWELYDKVFVILNGRLNGR